MTRENIKTPDGGTLELYTTGAELASAGSGVVVVQASMVTAAEAVAEDVRAGRVLHYGVQVADVHI